ncbi:hypothetical protein [Lampropedia cohaerens]|uniref:hypothetical protein n=1 Tax=Lampropedia cohaerens TaxID=1610491 RepID=UPI0012E3D863|nr:hypothetical protein [Lampropedia cohaerens]
MNTKTTGKKIEEAADKADEAIRDTAETALDKVERGVDKASDVAHDVADRALEGAEQAVQSTRRTVDEGLREVERGVRGLREHADPTIDQLAHKALDVATQSINLVADTSERARERVLELQEATCRYVHEKPGKALLFSAAAGALFTLLLTGGRRR